MKYQVISGIFEGAIFNGCIQSNRVYNTETIGQSYPVKNCIELKDTINVGDKVKIIKKFPNGDYVNKIVEVVEVSKLCKPIFYIEIEGIKTVCLPEYVEII